MAESSTKRQRVGQRQRLLAVSTDEALQTSKLATYLEEQWSWGYMSAQTCQKIAALAVFDMEAAPLSLRKISAIGTCGSHSQNCHRDFLALVATKTKICKPLQEKVPFKDGLYLQSIMLPHELFHCMWKEYKEYFIHALAPGGSNRLVSFWKSFEKHPCMQSGAMTAIRQHRSYPHRCLPVGMHGDAVPTTGVGKIWAKMQLCFSWFCLLRRKGSKASNFLIWSGFETLMSKSTLDHLFKILVWSFGCMASGKFPSKDWNGNEYDDSTQAGKLAGAELADGFIAPLICLMGDLEFHSNHLQMPRWNVNSNCCSLCQAAGKGPLTFRNFQSDAVARVHERVFDNTQTDLCHAEAQLQDGSFDGREQIQ